MGCGKMVPTEPGVPNGVAEIHHDLTWWLGYLCVALPVMALCAGLLDGPWAAGFAYAVLLLGVGSTWRVMLPPQLLSRVRRQVARMVFGDGEGNHEVTSPESAMAWCGYVLIVASMLVSSFGIAGTPGAALLAHALLLLGFGFISMSMLPLRPMESFLREENRAARNGNGHGHRIVPRADGMDLTGYYFVAATVLSSWAVEGPAATFFTFALLLLGVTFITIAMRAMDKPKKD
ncbi:unnamed protein product [Urochloa humidicola]